MDNISFSSPPTDPTDPSSLDNTTSPPPKLWNPNAVCLWSFPFTPLFGAWVQAENWRELGDEDKARTSMMWVGISGTFLLVVPLLGAPKGAGFLFLMAWYLLSGKKQVSFVKTELQDRYEKKSWTKPLLIAVPIWLLILAVNIFFIASALHGGK